MYVKTPLTFINMSSDEFAILEASVQKI